MTFFKHYEKGFETMRKAYNLLFYWYYFWTNPGGNKAAAARPPTSHYENYQS